ncbi:MAG: hypothetical protein SGPRY_014262 [Prymnesium sp.]
MAHGCAAMPRYYCEYCDISLTHSSVPGRKQHHSGRKHIMNYIEYWAAYQSAVPAHNPAQRPTAPRPGAQSALGFPPLCHRLAQPPLAASTSALPPSIRSLRFVPPPLWIAHLRPLPSFCECVLPADVLLWRQPA